MRVLLRLPRWVGDVVMAEPVVRALGAELGDALTLAGAPQLLDLVGPSAPSARRLPCGRRPDATTWRGHDAVLLLDSSISSAVAAVRARIPLRAGLTNGARGFLLTHGLTPALERGQRPIGIGRVGRWPRRLPRPFGAKCVELAQRIGVTVRDRRPRLELTEEAFAAVDEAGPYVAIQVGCRPGSAKGYPVEGWVAVIEAARRRGLGQPIVLLAGPGEEDAARQVAAATGARPIVDPVATLPELAAWCARARLVVSTDGGVRHVAAAMGTPRVVLFGPTDPRHTTEAQAGEVHVREFVDCGPCHKERCPLSGAEHLACTNGIDPERVALAMLPGSREG